MKRSERIQRERLAAAKRSDDLLARTYERFGLDPSDEFEAQRAREIANAQHSHEQTVRDLERAIAEDRAVLEAWYCSNDGSTFAEFVERIRTESNERLTLETVQEMERQALERVSRGYPDTAIILRSQLRVLHERERDDLQWRGL